MKRPLGYADGFATAIAVLGLAAAAYLASAVPRMGAMYRDLNPTMISGTTKLAISTAWCFGAPLVLVAAFIAAHVWRPRFAILAVAIATIAVDVFWYLAAWGPVFELSGNIQ